MALAVLLAADPDTGRTTFVTDFVQVIFGLCAVVAAARRVWQSYSADDRRSAAVFLSLAGGISAWTVGQIFWFYARNIDKQPLPVGHLHDVGYLLMPVGVGVGLWMRASQYGLSTQVQLRQRILMLGCGFCASYAVMALMMVSASFSLTVHVLVFAIYPASDLTLTMLALLPAICGYRPVGSAFLATALLAAAASDTGYLMLRADPATQAIPGAAALGFITFTILLTIWAFLAQPLLSRPRFPSARRYTKPGALSRDLRRGSAVSAASTVVCGLIMVRVDPRTFCGIVGSLLVVAASVSLAFLAAVPHLISGPETDTPEDT